MNGLGLYVLVLSNAVRDAIRRTGARYLLLMNEAIALADEFPTLYTIARSQATFFDCPNLYGLTLDDCYSIGQSMARVMLSRCYRPTVKCWMGPNEASPTTIIGAEQRGAFEAGVASIVHRDTSADYAAFHFSTGTTEADLFVAAWRTFARLCPHLDRVVLCYHGYARAREAAVRAAEVALFERRPFDDTPDRGPSWRTATLAAGLPWSKRIMITEGLFDAGAIDQNGYREQIGSEVYASIIRGAPVLVPECEAVVVFVCGGTDDWVERGFDILGDDVVLDAIAETNAAATPPREETPMPTTWNPAQVWAGYQERLSRVRAFDKYLATHLELGGWIDADEYDVGDYRLRGACGGLVYARIGDWGNVRHATFLASLPKA